MLIRRWMLFQLLAVSLFLGLGHVRAADVDDQAAGKPADQFAAHLAAGEFPAARAMAQQMAPDMRDLALARLAGAQLRGGARGGFASTLRDINSGGVMGGFGNQIAPQYAAPQNLQGGANQADFTELMDLIKKTTGNPKPGWVDDGGVGTVEEFRAGCYVDATGLLHKVGTVASTELSSIRSVARATSNNRDVRKQSTLRKVSLTRLERELVLRRAMGENADDAMRSLAGLTKIQYVMAYPETGEIVIAGPAAGWRDDAEGRVVSVVDGRPTLQLDDLIVLMRYNAEQSGVLGCSIDPRQDNLNQLQAFLSSQTSPLKPGQRDSWVSKLRELAGTQDIRVFGIDPRTRVANVLVEADYRMKLIGMGLEEGTLGLTSYLDSIQLDKNGQVPPMSVLRWWFSLNYEALQASESRDIFEIKGQGVKVLSENQLLAERGKRVGTGKSDELNSQFADGFTKNFTALAAKYPVYAELQNICDLALVTALMKAEDLPGQVGWQMAFFSNPELCPVALGNPPKTVESIVNSRVIGGKKVVAGVSGGVSIDPRGLVTPAKIKTDSYGKLKAERSGSTPKSLHDNAWWWD